MLGKTAQLEIPRRVVVYYLLFCLLVVAWLLASVAVVCQSTLRQHEEGAIVSFVARSTASTTIEWLRSGAESLQPLVERLTRERPLLYCAVISADGRYVAHTLRDRVGKLSREPVGRRVHCGDITVIHCAPGGGASYRECRAPLDAGEKRLGTLVMAVNGTGFWDTLRLTAAKAPLTLLTPFLFVAVGAVVLGRLVVPLAAVESQLRQAAVAPTVADIELRPLDTHTPGAVGWNRLIQQLKEGSREGGLERRLSEALQSLRQEKADDVFNSLSDGLAVTDSDGRVTYANPALAALAGTDVEPKSLHGKTIEQVLQLPPDDPAVAEFANPNLRLRAVVQEFEEERDGAPRILRLARNPIRTADRGNKSGHVWSVRDITQQRLAERMRDQFLDSATHELRTPLANIRAYAETLALSDVLDVESQKEFCNTINAEASRLARFIDDLLSISSMEMGSLALNRQEADLQRLFSEVLSKVKPQMDQKGIVFNSVFPEKYPRLKVDKDKMTVALVNLLGNAAKYTPEGGQVTFRVQANEKDLRVEVEDTGVGISEAELPRIFEKFFRSANPVVQAQTGTGLGLSMAMEVIHLHGGDLTATSQLGKGTTFTAVFPLH